MRQGLAMMLSEQDDLRVVGEASTGVEAIRQARKLAPDVVLMDFSMPEMDGVEATEKLSREMPKITIIGLSMYEQSDRSEAMISAGASAYLSKSGPPAELLETIHRLHAEAGGNGKS
jgi:DNA-binding NarL/FixJ family response regulator